jgi:hypothetical protein
MGEGIQNAFSAYLANASNACKKKLNGRSKRFGLFIN